MKPLVKRLRERGFDIRVINVDRHPGKAAKAEIEAIPTFIHYRNGETTKRFTGSATEWQITNCFRP